MAHALKFFDGKPHQFPRPIKEGKRSIRIPMNPDRCPNIMEAVSVGWNLVCGAFNLKKILFRRKRDASSLAPPGASGLKNREKVRKKRSSCAFFPGMMAGEAI